MRDYRACATSAMREAANGPQIVELVRSRSGIAIRSSMARQRPIRSSRPEDSKETLDPDRTYLYVDVGGGSTEIVVYACGSKCSISK